MKLKIVSLSAMPFLLIITAVPSQISASSSRDFIAGWVLSANKIMNLSSVDFAIIKKSPLLSFAIMGALTFFSLFIFNRQSRARIFSFFADSIISISPVFCSGSSTDRFSACSFVIGIPWNFITIIKQVSPLSGDFSIFRPPFQKICGSIYDCRINYF